MRRFRRFVAYAYERSPYYRQLILESKIYLARCVPADFFVLHKSESLENFAQIVTLPGVRIEDIRQFLSESRSPEQRFRDRYSELREEPADELFEYWKTCSTDENLVVDRGLSSPSYAPFLLASMRPKKLRNLDLWKLTRDLRGFR